MIRHLTERISHLYPPNEARAVVLVLLEDRFGITLTDICCGSLEKMSQEEKGELEALMCRLEKAEPVQYVIGYTWFAERKFNVTSDVLIPRPETEKLCNIVEQEISNGAVILDIGTGSGCIAVTLALNKPNSLVTAWDISLEALDIAKSNALRLGAAVVFEQKDALHINTEINKWDIIVSNPPYVRRSETSEMERHVLEYEPEIALFVEDDDPLCFYRSIGQYALTALKPGGRLFFEVNTALAEQTANMLVSLGFNDAHYMKDDFGLPRFVIARQQ